MEHKLFSRESISVQQLKLLKVSFTNALHENEFVTLLQNTVDSNLSELHLSHLFQKIDINSDGTVDWDEFTNFMFLSDEQEAVDLKETPNSFYIPICDQVEVKDDLDNTAMRPKFQHTDKITKILKMEKPAHYLTASKDGSIRSWDVNTLEYQSTVLKGDSWISDCLHMPVSNRIVVATMDRHISFYDANSHVLLGQRSDHSKAQSTPLCLANIVTNDNNELLLVGNDTGSFNLYTCSDKWLQCDTRSTAYTIKSHGFSSISTMHPHCNWVTNIGYLNELRSIVTTSLDTTVKIVDMERMVQKFEYTKHKKGVYDYSWSPISRLMITSGIERDISVWNPYSSDRAVATLIGHNASVEHVTCDDAKQQIISVSSDNVCKIWDFRTYRCLQTIANHESLPFPAVSAMLYDRNSLSLLLANRLVTKWQSNDVMEEKNPLSASEDTCCGGVAIYNPIFNQVVSASNLTRVEVTTWNADSGEKVNRFGNQETSAITSLIFDSTYRRILSGNHEGAQVSLWNFSNGANVKNYTKIIKERTDSRTLYHKRDIHVPAQENKLGGRTKLEPKKDSNSPTKIESKISQVSIENESKFGEITCLLDFEKNIKLGGGEYATQHYVCCAGWDRRIYVWTDTSGDKQTRPLYIIPRSKAANLHKTDILALAYISPSNLVSSDADGQILLWNFSSGELLSKLFVGVNAINCLYYSGKFELLHAVGDDGMLRVFDNTFALCATLKLYHRPDTGITCIASDTSNEYFVTGDAIGFVTVWTITVSSTGKGYILQHESYWSVGEAKMISVSVVEPLEQLECFVLTSLSSGLVEMWTTKGVPIGRFGSGSLWKLGQSSSYLSRKSRAFVDSHMSKVTVHHTVEPSKSTTSSTGTQHMATNGECALPKVGEVWVLSTNSKTIDHENLSNLEHTNQFDSPSALFSVPEISAIITILRVARGELVAWDGANTDLRRQRTFSLHDFSRGTGWVKHSYLTQFVGRVFRTETTSLPFKVLYVAYTSTFSAPLQASSFMLVDTSGKAHHLQALEKTLSNRRKLRVVTRGVMQTHRIVDAVSIAQTGKSRWKGAISNPDDESLSAKFDAKHCPRIKSNATRVPQAIYPRRHELGGSLPKRSALRMKHDTSVDFRRVHQPVDIPKNLKDIMQRFRKGRLLSTPKRGNQDLHSII